MKFTASKMNHFGEFPLPEGEGGGEIFFHIFMVVFQCVAIYI
jgi:hypothetical protein